VILLPDTQVEEPAKTRPTFDVDAVAAVLTANAEGRLRGGYDKRLNMLRRTIAENEVMLRSYAERIREVNRDLGERRAELHKLESTPPAPADAETIARDIRRMRNYPGVLGLWVDERGRIVAHVHTNVIYKNRRYHMGDFEVILGEPREYHPLDIRCTRTGQLPIGGQCPCLDEYCDRKAGYTRHFYWTPRSHANGGLGSGSFCFGTRARELESLRDQGRYAELLHLVLATMCSVNPGHEDGLSATYQSVRVGGRRRLRLRKRGVAIVGEFND